MKIIAGNWKMNKTQAETKSLIEGIIPFAEKSENLVIACVPFTDLAVATEAAKGSKVHVGAQNVHWAESGAFTGEISVAMLKEIGVEYVVIGHSERRQYFGETDETVMKRTIAALGGGLKPIVCVGETLEERESGRMEDVLRRQVENGFAEIAVEALKDVIIAYEPVWAIGTGKTATADDADNTIAFIRKVLCEKYGCEAAKAMPILYGGSMNDKNAAELLGKENIDGGLIGGASLVAEKFAKIIEA